MTNKLTNPPATPQSLAASQPPQPSSASSLSSVFDALEGIEPARNVRVRQKTSLEKLLILADAFLQEPIDEVTAYIGVEYFGEILIEYSSKKYEQLSKQLADVPIDEATLEEFVFSMLNSDHSEDKGLALGVFTGILAQIVTERNQAQGKRTRIYINGNGNKFDYLFYGANNVDEIFLQNLRGNDICSYIQNASRLVGVGLFGNSIFDECGDFRKEKTKRVKEVVVIGVNGNHNLNNLKNVVHLTAVGMNGQNNITISADESYAERIVGFNINNTCVLRRGSSAEILLIGIEGDDTDVKSRIKTGKLVHYIDVPLTIGAKLCNIIYGSSSEEYKLYKSRLDAAKFIYRRSAEEYTQHTDCLDADKLAEHLKDKSKEEVMKIVDEITRYASELSSRLLVK